MAAAPETLAKEETRGAPATMTTAQFQAKFESVIQNCAQVIKGKDEQIRVVMTALLADGHVLLEDMPGTGKTMLARTIAQTCNVLSNRIQCTPDLLPSDITGSSVIDMTTRDFTFRPGPVFTNILLADEINRATPKTQSALLEAMQERHVTVGTETRPLPEPFFVLATQNPIELEGTYPLPEAQLDRFLFKLLVPFPSAVELGEIVRRTTGDPLPPLRPVADAGRLLAMAALARQVPIADHVIDYAVRLVTATHPDRGHSDRVARYVRYGASPRGVQALVLGAKVRALLDGRFNVAFDDLRATARPALRHRVFLNFEADAAGVTSDDLIGEILDSVVADPAAA